VPMVLNTSFNENEPVVCEPALGCFLRTRMDVLLMGETSLFREHAMQKVQAETHDLAPRPKHH